MSKDGAVEKVLELMDAYSLSQGDFDSVVELSKLQGHLNPMDGVQPAVKAALTRAYKQGSSSRVVRAADLIALPGVKKAPKKRIAAILEPVEGNLPDKTGDALVESEEDNSSDAEDNGEVGTTESKPQLDLRSDDTKGIQVQLDLKSNGNGKSKAKMTPASKSRGSDSAEKAPRGSGGKRKR